MSTTVIKLDLLPVWARMEILFAITGVPDNRVRELYNDRKIRARKLRDVDMPDSPNVAVVFNVLDVLEWIEKDAVEPKPYVLGGKAADQQTAVSGG